MGTEEEENLVKEGVNADNGKYEEETTADMSIPMDTYGPAGTIGES